MPSRSLAERLRPAVAVAFVTVLAALLVVGPSMGIPGGAPWGGPHGEGVSGDAAPSTAHAVEEGEEEDELDPDEGPEPPDYEEVCAEDQVGAEFCPETYEAPSFFVWLVRPLLIVGFVLASLLLIAYLVYQPRFAREDEDESQRTG